MNKRIAIALWLAAGAPLASADVVELSPDLYLAVVSIAGSNSCSPPANQAAAAAAPELFRLQALSERGVLVTNEAEAEAEADKAK